MNAITSRALLSMKNVVRSSSGNKDTSKKSAVQPKALTSANQRMPKQQKTKTKTRNGSSRVMCPLCLKTFGKKGSLKRHMRSHSGEKPFKCTFCGKRFSRKSHLTMHMRVHTGERPFPCDICVKRFMQKSDLIRHKRVHTGEKPFVCEVKGCNKRYAQKSHLRIHMRTHKKNETFTCSLCSNVFSSMELLNRHASKHAEVMSTLCPSFMSGISKPLDANQSRKRNFVDNIMKQVLPVDSKNVLPVLSSALNGTQYVPNPENGTIFHGDRPVFSTPPLSFSSSMPYNAVLSSAYPKTFSVKSNAAVSSITANEHFPLAAAMYSNAINYPSTSLKSVPSTPIVPFAVNAHVLPREIKKYDQKDSMTRPLKRAKSNPDA